MAVIVRTILQLHIVRVKKEIIRKLCICMLVSKMSSWVIWVKQKSTTDSQTYRLFSAFLRMFTGMLQSTGAGGLETVKMFQALCAQLKVVKLLLSIYRAGSSWLTGLMEVHLRAYKVRTLLHSQEWFIIIDFTLSNARRFYSPKGDSLGVKGLKNYLS